MKKATPQKPLQDKQTKSSTSEISLSQLTLKELRDLQRRISDLLSPDADSLKDTDIVLEYEIKIRTNQGIVSENKGTSRLNSLLNLRLLADAPNRFEHEFLQQVYGPVSADVYDLIEAANPTNYVVSPVVTPNDKYNVMPGLNTPVLSLGTLPGE